MEELVRRITQLERRLDGLVQPEVGKWLPLAVYEVLAHNLGTDDSDLWSVTISRSITYRSLHMAVYVVATNNGSNYWTFTLKKTSAETTVDSVNTSAISADSWVVLSSTGNSDALIATDEFVIITATKTGTPGNLYATTPMVYVTMG